MVEKLGRKRMVNFLIHQNLKVHYASRRRYRRDLQKKILSPSPTLIVGPGAVGTGTLAGMKFNLLKIKQKFGLLMRLIFN